MEYRIVLEVEDGITGLAGQLNPEWIDQDCPTEEIISILAAFKGHLLGSEAVERISKGFNDGGPDQILAGWIDQTIDDFTTAIEALNRAHLKSQVGIVGSVVKVDSSVHDLLDIDFNPVKGTNEIFGIVRAINDKAVGSHGGRISDPNIDGAGEGHNLRAIYLDDGRY